MGHKCDCYNSHKWPSTLTFNGGIRKTATGCDLHGLGNDYDHLGIGMSEYFLA